MNALRVACVALTILLASSTSPRDDEKWTPLDTGTKARLRGLGAVDRRIAWASGTGGTCLRTIDGGSSWKALTVPGASKLDFRDLHAIDADSAYLMSAGAGDLSRIYKTTDGGATWALLVTNPDPQGFWDAIAFWDADHGLALGDPVEGRFVLFRTEDGGKTWARTSPAGMPPALEGEGGFAASGTCLVVGKDGHAWFGTGGARTARVFRSTDRGQTWAAHECPIAAGSPSAGIFSLAFHADGHGIAVGGDYKKPGETKAVAATTADGGKTWVVVEGRPPSGYRSGVCFLDDARGNACLAVGPEGSDFSQDGGKTWTRLGDRGFDAILAASDGSAWASGEGGRAAGLRPIPADRR